MGTLSTMSQTFSPSDVASHNKADNLWIIVDQDVYDLTKFQDEHPGGKKILQRVAARMPANSSGSTTTSRSSRSTRNSSRLARSIASQSQPSRLLRHPPLPHHHQRRRRQRRSCQLQNPVR